jgi:hypothetical protein
VEDQRPADQAVAETRRDERTTSLAAVKPARTTRIGAPPCAGYARTTALRRAGQYLVSEDVVGNVDTYKPPCLKHYRDDASLVRDARGRKGPELDHDEMDEADPYHSPAVEELRTALVMVVDPK